MAYYVKTNREMTEDLNRELVYVLRSLRKAYSSFRWPAFQFQDAHTEERYFHLTDRLRGSVTHLELIQVLAREHYTRKQGNGESLIAAVRTVRSA